VLALGHDPVDADLEEVVDPGGDEHVAAVGARRDHGSTQPLVPRGLHEPNRPLVGLYPLLADGLEHQVVLARSQRVHGLRLGWVGGRPHGQVDPPRLEEGVHAVQAGLAVDVLVVVGGAIEWVKRLTRPLGPVAQEVVEHLLPRPGVDPRGSGEHAVQIEQARRDAIRSVEHGVNIPSDQSARAPSYPGVAGDPYKGSRPESGTSIE
jgi:hypothetical protein